MTRCAHAAGRGAQRSAARSQIPPRPQRAGQEDLAHSIGSVTLSIPISIPLTGAALCNAAPTIHHWILSSRGLYRSDAASMLPAC